MVRGSMLLAFAAVAITVAGCTNPVQPAHSGSPLFNGGSMGSGGKDGGGTAADTTQAVTSSVCYAEENGGSMGSGGLVIVPCTTPAK